MHLILPSRYKRHNQSDNHRATSLRAKTNVIRPRANTTHQSTLLYTLPTVYNFNPSSPLVSILCHVLRQPQTIHIASNDRIPTRLRPTPPSLILQKLQRLTSSHWCTRTPPLNVPKPSQPSLPQLIFYRCNPYPLSDHHISNPIQPSIATHPPDHSHLSYHQPLGLDLLDRPTFCLNSMMIYIYEQSY